MAELEETDTTDIDTLSDPQIAEIRDVFSFFDKDCDGLVPLYELGPLLRSLGLNPTEVEINDYMANLKERDEKAIDFKECLTCYAQKYEETQETIESLCEAFRKWDKDAIGYVSTVEFRKVMTTYGEKLSDEQVDELIEEADDGNERIQYKAFCKTMLGPV